MLEEAMRSGRRGRDLTKGTLSHVLVWSVDSIMEKVWGGVVRRIEREREREQKINT